jgi:hypothetical protein
MPSPEDDLCNGIVKTSVFFYSMFDGSVYAYLNIKSDKVTGIGASRPIKLLKRILLAVFMIGIPCLAVFHTIVEKSKVKNGRCASNSDFRINLGAHIFGASLIVFLNIGYFLVFFKKSFPSYHFSNTCCRGP